MQPARYDNYVIHATQVTVCQRDKVAASMGSTSPKLSQSGPPRPGSSLIASIAGLVLAGLSAALLQGMFACLGFLSRAGEARLHL